MFFNYISTEMGIPNAKRISVASIMIFQRNSVQRCEWDCDGGKWNAMRLWWWLHWSTAIVIFWTNPGSFATFWAKEYLILKDNILTHYLDNIHVNYATIRWNMHIERSRKFHPWIKSLTNHPSRCVEAYYSALLSFS